MKKGGWVQFLQDYRIPYKKSSGNNVEIRCCLCTDDHSTNLGLSTKSSAWNCWRNDTHRGLSPVRVIQALLGIPYSEAKDIGRLYFDWKTSIGGINFVEKEIEWVKKPEEFYPFEFKMPHENVFIDYIKKRGLDPQYTVRRFNLHYALSGMYAHRIIIPIIQDDHWYSWVARTPYDNQEIRYVAASEDDVKSQPKNHLFDFDNLLGGRLLVVTEGAFDGLSITASMLAGVHGTALFGKMITDVQVGLLMQLSKRYDHIALGLDEDAFNDSVRGSDKLRGYLPEITRVYPTGKDWNAMSPKEIRECLRV